MDIGKAQVITGVAIRGRGDTQDWVEEFMVSYSKDGKEWIRLREAKSAKGFPNNGEAVGRLFSGAAQFTWPGPSDALAGRYQLCWRRAAAPPDSTAVGTLVLQGPIGGQTFRCDVGRPCRISGLDGIGLRRGDSFRPLAQCGMSGKGAPVAYAGDEKGTDFDWGMSAAHLEPKAYRLCWCRPWVTEKSPPVFLLPNATPTTNTTTTTATSTREMEDGNGSN